MVTTLEIIIAFIVSVVFLYKLLSSKSEYNNKKNNIKY